MTEVQTILVGAFDGSLPVETAIARLRPFAKLDLFANPAFFTPAKPLTFSIPLDPPVVAAQLRRFLEGAVSARDLQGWAALVLLSGSFDAPSARPVDEDWYDDLWDVVNDLACPSVFGPITATAVADKVGRLAKYLGSPV